MERELVRHSEGYWSLVDEKGQLICKFKIGDEVQGESNPHSWIDDVTSPFRGFIEGVLYMEHTIGLLIYQHKYLRPEEAYSLCVTIDDIENMEVIE